MNNTTNHYIENYELKGELLEIFEYPSPILKKVATPVESFDDKLKENVMNMIYTMYQTPGIGLAAPQVGISERYFVIDVGYDLDEDPNDPDKFVYNNLKPMVIINPVFKNKDGEIIHEEG